MNLQKNIAATMSQVTTEINASTQTNSDVLRKINLLKSSINSVVNLSPDDIVFENNVRHEVDEGSPDFDKLCESIKKFGLLKNVVAELHISEQEDSYKLVCIAGHRRLTALKKLGLKNKIPCLIKQYNSGDRVGAALSENLNREGLNCVDVANGYLHLTKNDWSIEQIAQHFEKDKKTVARFLKLAELPDDIKELFQQNSSIFPNRVIFNEILSGNKLPNEIRKAIQRKLSRKNPEKKASAPKIQDRLQEFFNNQPITDQERELILEAFKFVGLLK